jgi:Ca2+-binding EF-hand superfamily protein
MLTTEQFEAAFAEYDINNDGKIGKKEGFAFVQQLMIKYHKEEDSESD